MDPRRDGRCQRQTLPSGDQHDRLVEYAGRWKSGLAERAHQLFSESEWLTFFVPLQVVINYGTQLQGAGNVAVAGQDLVAISTFIQNNAINWVNQL